MHLGMSLTRRAAANVSRFRSRRTTLQSKPSRNHRCHVRVTLDCTRQLVHSLHRQSLHLSLATVCLFHRLLCTHMSTVHVCTLAITAIAFAARVVPTNACCAGVTFPLSIPPWLATMTNTRLAGLALIHHWSATANFPQHYA
jgi:hypothetical protein